MTLDQRRASKSKAQASLDSRLQWAARDGDHSEVQKLLRRGADPLAATTDGVTALIFAAWFGQIRCVELLLPRSDALARASDDFTALMAAVLGNYGEIVRLLAPASDLSAKHSDGMTAAMLADQRRHHELASWLRAAELSRIEAFDLAALSGPSSLASPKPRL